MWKIKEEIISGCVYWIIFTEITESPRECIYVEIPSHQPARQLNIMHSLILKYCNVKCFDNVDNNLKRQTFQGMDGNGVSC